MRILRRALAAALLCAAALAATGCSALGRYTPPDWAWFDVVGHPTGAVPATLGYYGGVLAWSPAEFVLVGLLPWPADEVVGRGPGAVLGTGAGLVLGAPFHLLALPFSGGGDVDPGGAGAEAVEETGHDG